MTSHTHTTAVDVLIPTYNRASALAVTLTGLMAQTLAEFRVLVSDQSPESVFDDPVVGSALRVLHASGRPVDTYRHVPRRGIAEHRQFLLDQATADHVLVLDDDIVCEPDLLERMHGVLVEQRCGFVGSAMIGLSHRDDVRPHEQEVEFWEGTVEPERIDPGTPAWERWRLHNAANPWHVQRRLGLTAERQRLYKVAWVAGCVLYDRVALVDCGGFEFWRDLPDEHSGEDVVAQQRVMAVHGGCGLLPSGAYHQELETTLPRRDVDAPHVLGERWTGRAATATAS